MALNVTAWHCNADIISSVSVLPLGEHHAQVHIDLNSNGKRARVVSTFVTPDDKVGVILEHHPWDGDPDDENTRRSEDAKEATITLHTTTLAHILGVTDGRYTIFLYLATPEAMEDLGETVERVEVPPCR